MKKVLSVFLVLALMLTCVLSSASSVFALNNGMTDDQVFNMCWESACSNYSDEDLRNCFPFLEDYQYIDVSLDTSYLYTDECKQQVREVIRNVGTDPETLGDALYFDVLWEKIWAFSPNSSVGVILRYNMGDYELNFAHLLAKSYNDVKDAMNGDLIIEFSSTKYGDEIASYFDKHRNEVAAAIPQEYAAISDGIITAAELYLINHQDKIVDIMDNLLSSDDTLANKQIVIQDTLYGILTNIMVSYLGEGNITQDLQSTLADVAAEYSEVVCNQFETYLATMMSNSNPAILSGCICLAVGVVAGIFIGRKKKQAE